MKNTLKEKKEKAFDLWKTKMDTNGALDVETKKAKEDYYKALDVYRASK